MAQKQNGKIFGLLAALVAVFAVAMFGLNFVTGPLIAKNGNAQELAPLYSVMSEAAGFEKLYDVSPVYEPAYYGTSVELDRRGYDELIAKEEKEKQQV